MRSGSKLFVTVAALLIGAAGAAFVWRLTDPATVDRFWDHHALETLQYVAPALVAFIGWTAQRLLSPAPLRSTYDQLKQAQLTLAHRGLEWWRGVPEPAWPGRLLRAGLRPLVVPWEIRRSDSKLDSQANADAPASGQIPDIVTWLKDGTNSRLFIGGPASSGKSVFARRLMAELLKVRREDDPVPVFLPLWSWDPGQQSLHDWIKYRIGLTYPELRNEAIYGPTAIAGLVDQGRVLPILDGLEALPSPVRAEVWRDGGLMSQAPLIITGRTEPSAAAPPEPAARRPGAHSSASDDFVVIEPGRVKEREADRFLQEITGVDVFAELRRLFVAAPGGATDDELREVVCTSRIVYLASIVYQARELPPDQVIPGDTTAGLYERVEGFLLRNVIPALLPAGEDWCRTFPWYATGAEGWLKQLARRDLRDPGETRGGLDLDDPGTSRIAWWNLYRGIPFLRNNQAWLRALPVALAAFGLGAFFFSEKFSWSRYTLMTAGGYALLILIAGSVLGAAGIRDPGVIAEDRNTRLAALRWMWRYYRARWGRIFLAAFLGFCGFGVLIGLRTALEPRHTALEGVRTGIGDGLVQGAVLLVLTYFIAGVPAAPRAVRVTDFPRPGRNGIRTFTSAVVTGILFGLLWGIAAVLKKENGTTPLFWPSLGTGLITGTDFAVGAWLFRWSRRWFRAPSGADPRSAARMDLAGAILRPLILGVTFTVSFGVSAPFHFVAGYLMPWFVVGVAAGILETEWLLYAAAISWLALARRDLPVRLMRFLECCRAAGILRTIGQEYQIHDMGLLRWLRREPPAVVKIPARRGPEYETAAQHDSPGGTPTYAGAQDP
jgi:hypothetical protein